MAIFSNEDRRDGDEWPDEDLHAALRLMDMGGEQSLCFE